MKISMKMSRYLLFALLSLALLGSLFLMLFKESSREWKRYQRAFYKKEKEKALTRLDRLENQEQKEMRLKEMDTGQREIDLKQIYLKELNRTDRCITCHLGIDSGLREGEKNPYRSHPGEYLSKHPSQKYGCTVCHEGQGLATTTKAAHQEVKGWDRPLVPWEYIEAPCGRCHLGEIIPQAPILTAGKKFYKRYGCPGCHQIKGVEEAEEVGSSIFFIGSKVKRSWLLEFLSNPEDKEVDQSSIEMDKPEGDKARPKTHDPNFKLSFSETANITEYLMGLIDPRIIPEDPRSPDKGPYSRDPSQVKEGRDLVENLGCTTCHEISGHSLKGFIPVERPGGDLSATGSKVHPSWLVRYLKAPKSYQAETRMPAYRLTEDQIDKIVSYLMTLRDQKFEVLHSNLNGAEASAEKGKRLIKRYNCIGCHRIKGIEEGERGPDLKGIGSRTVGQLDYGDKPAGAERTLLNWLYAKVMTPRIFRETLKMPYPYITKEETRAVVTYLLSLTKEMVPPQYKRETPSMGQKVLPMGGEIGELISDLQCKRCHSFDGRGRGIAPDLSFEGGKVKRDWLLSFLKDPGRIRPILAARMPRFNLSEREASLLVEFIEMVLQREPFPDNSTEKDLEMGFSQRGERLFFKKFPCIGCHKVGVKGGEYGPDLTHAGKRLKSKWIYKWLKDPQAFDPTIKMPNLGLSSMDRADLTLYLSGLK